MASEKIISYLTLPEKNADGSKFTLKGVEIVPGGAQISLGLLGKTSPAMAQAGVIGANGANANIFGANAVLWNADAVRVFANPIEIGKGELMKEDYSKFEKSKAGACSSCGISSSCGTGIVVKEARKKDDPRVKKVVKRINLLIERLNDFREFWVKESSGGQIKAGKKFTKMIEGIDLLVNDIKERKERHPDISHKIDSALVNTLARHGNEFIIGMYLDKN